MDESVVGSLSPKLDSRQCWDAIRLLSVLLWRPVEYGSVGFLKHIT